MTPAAAGKRSWHALDPATTMAELATSPDGLGSPEAQARLRRHGPNRLPAPPRRTVLARLAGQIHNLLIYVLLASALIAALLGHVVDATVILAVVLINAIIGFVQEGRAEDALASIRGMIDPNASVLRHGKRSTVPAEAIVPGDIVLLEAGDRVPADLRLIRARSLKLDEAALTGESVPVDKDTTAAAADAALGDRHSMAFSGTFVASGSGAGVVVGTGSATELGRISTLLGDVIQLRTPLIRQMDQFARQITLVTLAGSAAVFLFAVALRGYSVADAFMAVVGLAVAVIPEGLPAVMTITLAIGVRRMAARHAIIRRLPAVEALGSVTTICSDKTGTLTRNEMTVQSVVSAGQRFTVAGVGYAPVGAIEPPDDPVLGEIVLAALLCNDAQLRPTEGGWAIEGDPMEAALLVLAAKAGQQADTVRGRFRRVDEIPFDAQHRYMATLHLGVAGDPIVHVKGAPERVLEMCRTQLAAPGEAPLEPERWHRAIEAQAADGQRVLAVAALRLAQPPDRLAMAAIEGRMVFLGLLGLIDPPRPEAVTAVQDCRTAGIAIKMITGDHAATALAIARQLGLADEPRAVTGRELDNLDPAGLRRVAGEATVFARTSPEHKLRLVEALQAEGAVVAMTGDGVNDAPALKRADVGVAMGRRGTEAAKEVAAMVLADDNFASIAAAVREGRTVYDNLMKVVAWTLPTNGAEALAVIGAILLGLTLPLTPVQILWVNLLTASALGMTLAFEPTEPGTMRRPPRRPDDPILSAVLAWRILFVSLLAAGAVFALFLGALERGLPLETARTIAVNLLVALEIAYLFSVRYVHGSSLTWQGVLGTREVLIGVGIVVLAQLAFTYLPLMNRVFATRPLPLGEVAVIVAVAALFLGIVEAEKLLRRRLGRRPA
jgi:calcium-translocating P-type ATPase